MGEPSSHATQPQGMQAALLLQHAAARGPCPTVQEDACRSAAHLRRKTRPVEIPSFFLRCWPVTDARDESQSQVTNVPVPVPAHRLPLPPREVEKLAIGRQRRDQAIHGLGPQMVGGSLLGCGAPGWALSKLSFDCLPTSSQYSLTKMIDSMSESLATHRRVIREQPRHPRVLRRSIS